MSERDTRPDGPKPVATAKPEAQPAPFPLATPPNGVTMPREGEKQKIVRQLYNLIDRVDKL